MSENANLFAIFAHFPPLESRIQKSDTKIYKVEKSGLNDLLQVKYDNLICQYDAINTTGGMKNLPVVLFNYEYQNACGLRSPGLRGAEVPPPWVEARGSKGRRYGLHAPWGLSLRPLGIVPLPPKECLASPIGDIGVPP